jgi:hypothetical protein
MLPFESPSVFYLSNYRQPPGPKGDPVSFLPAFAKRRFFPGLALESNLCRRIIANGDGPRHHPTEWADTRRKVNTSKRGGYA